MLEYQQARLSRDKRFDGRFFVAVKSTHIFCRNICPAKLPKEENVEYFELAAQALQKGYRPCLRCRPDSAPNSYAWLGSETTLIRAMRLLRSEPEVGFEDIAAKLGISDGYLRKLFREKLGISPKQFQLSEQLLFAKKLLHETNLSVEQVAHNCGFNSSRRLQDNMQKAMKLTPTQIRKSEVQPTQTLKVKVPISSDYNWLQLRDFLARRAIPGIEEVTECSYEKRFMWGQAKGWFKATYEVSTNHFDVEIQSTDYSDLRAIINNIKRVLDTETDFDLIKNALLASGVKEHDIVPGLRVPGVWNVFEAGCRAILGQQVSVTAAVNAVSVLAENVGQNDVNTNQLNMFFPLPQAVAESDLQFLKMPDRRRQALRSFAKFMATSMQPEKLEQWLDIKGIGPWTVDYAKMRGLSEPDVWLDGDLVVKKRMKDREIQADKAAPWRSYLTLQMWSEA
ncbi:MAG: AraC family transcriptional regulator [Alteromonadaceae bacterium]|nr:AraC family transcriptional regulator [Alteromonadaceae bacterium]